MKYNDINEIIRDIELNPLERSGHIYHPIPFPEFSNLRTSSNSKQVYKKWRLIKEVLNKIYPGGLNGVRILDIGANAGFYTFSLAQEGAEVIAFESEPRYSAIGQFLAIEKRLPATWYDVPFKREVVSGQQFDVALALSVFQWMADGGNRLRKAIDDLRAISEISRFLIFELGFNKGTSCIRTRKLNHYAELVRFLNHNTVYDHFMLLGITRLWASSPRYLVLCSHEERFEDPALRRIMRMIRI